MSDLIRDSFAQFHQSIAASYQVLSENRTSIEDRKARMLELLETSIKIPEPPKGAGEYQQLCRETIGIAKAQLRRWQELIQDQIQRSEFVNRHEKSILALVSADVNAGKSSLGNFVGGWHFRDTPYGDLYTPYECLIEDRSKGQAGKDAETRDHFVENATEATSTIQYYTLKQGLTWVDTPGLHSLTKEHGDLAKEYIQFADLVIYLTSSSSPFKSDEREMLEELFRMGKPVILAITKSDDTCVDQVDGKRVYKLIPKDRDTRQAQEGYVTEQVQKLRDNSNLENSRVLSLSVQLARNAALQQDQQMYEGSNLPYFLAQMGEILSSKAIELKMRRPKAEVNAFLDRIINGAAVEDGGSRSIVQLRAELAQKGENLKTVLAQCSAKQEHIFAAVDQRLSLRLRALFLDLRKRGVLDDPEKVRAELSEVVTELVAEACREGLEKQLGALPVSLAPKLEVKANSNVKYEVVYAKQLVSKMVERAPRGFLEHFQKWLDEDTKFRDIVNETENIKAGDNLSTYLDGQVTALRPEIREHIAAAIDMMADACIHPLLERYQELDQQLGQLSEELEKLRFIEKQEDHYGKNGY